MPFLSRCCVASARYAGTVKPSWADLAELFRSLFELYRAEWGCRVPAYNQAPTAAVEAECDHWCRWIAAHCAESCPAPSHVQPWLLVRIVCASTFARRFARQPDTAALAPPERLDRAAIEALLIDLWHGHMKQVWPQLGRDEPWWFSA